MNRITQHVRKKNSKKIAKYYGSLGRAKSVHTGVTSSISRDYTKEAMHAPDTRTFRGEKVTLEEIENWRKNNLVKRYSHTGREIA